MTFSTRRRFFGASLSALVAGIGIPRFEWAHSEPLVSPDETWLQGLKGKHKQLFDVPAVQGGKPLGRVANFLDAYHEAYGLSDADLNVVVGVHGTALPLVMQDGIWSRYEFGRRFSETDSVTQRPSVQNPYANGGVSSVIALQKRGVRFIACMRSIRRLSGQLATPDRDAGRVQQELVAGLLPGVTPVPAMVVAVNRAQEKGLTYLFAG